MCATNTRRLESRQQRRKALDPVSTRAAMEVFPSSGDPNHIEGQEGR